MNVITTNMEYDMSNRDVEEGRCGIIDRGDLDCAYRNGIDDAPCDNALGEYDDGTERNTLLAGIGPLHTHPSHPYTIDVNLPNSIRNRNSNETISFREILPQDRKRINELFEDWFPVDYKEEFYDNLCNYRTMGGQPLYTLVATTPVTPPPGKEDMNQETDAHTIIACLLGCKLNARKLNEASRALLVPGYEPNISFSNNASDSSDQTVDNLDALGDPNACNNNPNDSDGEANETIGRTDVFYIMTLGVIDEYRKRGLASYLVERALQDQIVVQRDTDNGDWKNRETDSDSDRDVSASESYPSPANSHSENHCETAYLHVIIQNEAAIRFYEKLGFERLREIPDYYTIEDEKHNCYLYAKFFDKHRIDSQQGYHLVLVNFFHRTVTRWITSIWSSISLYWVFNYGEGGPNAVVAASKNK